MYRPSRSARACANLLAAAVCAGSVVLGAEASSPLAGFEATPPSAGLLGSGLLSRIDVNHSLSYGMTSSSAGTQSGGLWLTQVGYQASRPLRFSLDVGAAIDPSNGWMNENSFFLHRLAMDYQPSRHFQLHISYVNVPAPTAGVLGYSPVPGIATSPWGRPAGLSR
jgi:hypothetical protein